MHHRTALLVLAIALTASVSAVAQVVSIPANTVIPVVLDERLSSTVNQVGDRFFVHCEGTADCAGFPMGTRFQGVVTAVSRASGATPGQLNVSFAQAILPDGRVIPISGMLSSLDPNEVMVDPNTGLLQGRPGSAPNRNAFIGYGAGAGAVIGVITGNTLRGALIGAAAGWLYGATLRSTPAGEVTVPAGTRFGILLTQPVAFSRQQQQPPPTQPPGGAGPIECPRDLVFVSVAPYMTAGGVLMVPARATMDSLDVPFRYSSATRTLTVNTATGTATHVVGSNQVRINGTVRTLSAPSRIIGGNLYVPSDLLSAATGASVTWMPGTRTLRVQ